MRLYRLLSRHGKRKARLWPWFEPPAPDAPIKYDGWVWNPELREWVATDVEPITVELKVPRYPQPTEPPVEATPSRVPGWQWSDSMQEWFEVPLTRKEGVEGIIPGPVPTYVPTEGTPTDVEGWSWSERHEAWVATIVMAEKVGFTPPRSLPPNLTQKAVFDMFSWEQLYLEEVNAFVGQGYTLEAAKRITRENFDPLFRMLWAKQAAANKSAWKMVIEHFGRDPDFVKETITVYGAAIVLSAVVGFVIGTILERFTFVDETEFMLPEPLGTYLMGPDDWCYSRNIGASPQGNLYYSKCQGIGTEYSRHMRYTWTGLYDVIDFPGGFVEEGYQFPHWVKYTWSHWKIVYIGMMFSSSDLVHVLKKELISLDERSRRVTVRTFEDWCSDFHWYL